MIGLNNGSKWSAASTPKVISFDESGANPMRLARTLYRPGLGARRTYPPSSLLNVPATITPLGLTRTMVVPGELACDSDIWAVPLTCWQNKLGVSPTKATLSLNREAIFIDSVAGRFEQKRNDKGSYSVHLQSGTWIISSRYYDRRFAELGLPK